MSKKLSKKEVWDILSTPPCPIYGEVAWSREFEGKLAKIIREEIDKEIIAAIIRADRESR